MASEDLSLTCERVPRCDAAALALPLGAELLLAQPVLHLLLRRQLQLQLLFAVLLARGRARVRRASRQRRGRPRRLRRGLRGRRKAKLVVVFSDKRGPKSAERAHRDLDDAGELILDLILDQAFDLVVRFLKLGCNHGGTAELSIAPTEGGLQLSEYLFSN